ncbi:MAG: prepilin peptidase [Alphaproteobacteria bacterium]
MMDAVASWPVAYILSGVIWSVVLGFAAGNYACSLVHRLPRGKLMLDKTPYCGNCGTLLQVKDLFPVISALLLRHKCRYCGQPFPTSHTWTEVLIGLLFILGFLQHGFGEQYILIVLIGTFLVTLAAIEINENIMMGKILLCVIVFGMMYRILQDASIYPACFGGLYGMMLGAIIGRKNIKKVGHIYVLPPLALLLAAGGVCVGEKGLLTFFALFAAFYILAKILGGMNKPVRLTVPFGFAVILPVLYPNLVSL